MDGSQPLTAEREAAATPLPTEPAAAWPYPVWLDAVAEDPAFAWARIGWDAGLERPRRLVRHGPGRRVVPPVAELFKLTQDRFAGLPFKLADWQEIIVRLLVGWQPPGAPRPAEHRAVTVYQVRLFRKLLLWVPRKNGKSEFLAALGLLFFIVDGVADGEGYCFARDEKQARIVLKKMKAMIALNPEWSARS
jgi:hypothetical protein